MAGLARSDVSYKRSGSSGLVWDDKLLSGELFKPKEEEEKEKKEPQRVEPRPYKTMDVAPTIDPPSPRLSGCGAICTIFGKPVKNKPSTQNRRKKR
ncbi:uncharacterized protein At1g15400 [Lactuca sativa]|uniref:MAPK kinase substrate protein n=1 Tax=Lactuca sativa TaxID=4236 RepID=A0A9R1VCZ3_LACSA|nr:uncharacterized protein At1g15400 [Lactuca sativa]KAJ0204106.1 hypothetical protein LSAT_V11C500263800 [Lactuca sativa]